MSSYVLSCCSTADLTEEQLAGRDIRFLCFHFQLDGKDYPDDLGKSMAFEEFYGAMEKGTMTKTSQPNETEFETYFEDLLRQGQDVLHLSLSSGISGELNSAMAAAASMQEKYPDRKIYVVDSLAASGGYGLLMDKLADLRDEGKSIEEVRDFAEENKLRLHHWFFTSDLQYLCRGGRVSKTSYIVGSALSICPLLNVDYQGRLIPREKVRTKKRVIKRTVERMEEHAENGLEYTGKVLITNAACYEDARAVADLIEEKFTKMNGKVIINSIGTTIGSHTGPGTVALFFWGDQRVD